MHLSRLYIENYRSIKNLDLSFSSGKNVIVGKNNSGKSNIIKAIDLMLGESSPTYSRSENITKNDFYCEKNTIGGEGKISQSDTIFIWCELDNQSKNNIVLPPDTSIAYFSAQKKPTLEDYRIDGELSDSGSFTEELISDIFYFTSEQGSLELDSTGSYTKKWIGNKSYCKTTFDQITSKMNFFAFAFRAKIADDGSINKELVTLYREAEDEGWIVAMNFTLRNNLVQSAIIPAFRDTDSQLRINNYGWYGKLLKTLTSTVTSELKDAFESVKKESDKIFKNVTSGLNNGHIQIAFPNTSISVQFNPETKQDFYKQAMIYVDDGFNSLLQDKGCGIQSSVVIGLFDYYTREINHKGNTSLLAIEEPELYLHPQARRVISNRLDSFTDGGRNQVIISTHSPEFITSTTENLNLIVVKKQNNQATDACNLEFGDSSSYNLKPILIKVENAEMFFADLVILVEGADKYIIEQLAKDYGEETKIYYDGVLKDLGKNWINDYNISIIATGSKNEFGKYLEILNGGIKIKTIVVGDLDNITDSSLNISNLIEKPDLKQKYNELLAFFKANKKADFASKADISKRLDNKEGEKFFEAYEQFLSSNNPSFLLTEEIKYAFKFLENKVYRKKLKDFISDDETQISNLNEIIAYLFELNVFLLKKGDIEDYFENNEAGSHNPKAVLDLIANLRADDKISNHIADVSEFYSLFDRVLAMVGVLKVEPNLSISENSVTESKSLESIETQTFDVKSFINGTQFKPSIDITTQTGIDLQEIDNIQQPF